MGGFTTKGNKPGIAGRPMTTGYDTDALAQRFRAVPPEQGAIAPGQDADSTLINRVSQGGLSNPIDQISGWVKQLFGNRSKPTRK